MARPGSPALHLTPLAPPAVVALRREGGGQTLQLHRVKMERTASEDFREERQDLKEAAEHSQNVILDLNFDGTVKYVGPTWQNIIGTPTESVIGKPIADVVIDNKTAFAEAVESLHKDDSRSQTIRFSVCLGPLSIFRKKYERERARHIEDNPESPDALEHEPSLTLEAQGIIVFARTTGKESHIMWMMRPYVIREITIDLPEVLVESLGVGAEVLARYLTELAEAGVEDPAHHPPPLPILCRICERHITPWWFEKHTDLCLQEHKSEMEVQLAQETLTEHRNAIVKVLDALEAQSRHTRASSGDMAPPPPPLPEYKGFPIGPPSTPSSGPSSGRSTPARQPSRSRDRSANHVSHSRGRSFAVRRPIARIVELVLDLSDTAMEINTPIMKDNKSQSNGEFRTQSPQSESRISQVLQWQSPSTSTLEHEQGLSALCDDTATLTRAKVEAVSRHRSVLEYGERIRVEFEILVQECITAAMEKTAQLAAGEVSDSSEDTESNLDDSQDLSQESSLEQSTMETSLEDGSLQHSLEGSLAMASALRNASDPMLAFHHQDRRASSTATSTRSSSPRGSQTPRSLAGTASIAASKRASVAFESDAGAESDSSMRSSAISISQRADSPNTDLSQSFLARSRDRKRRSLILPSVLSTSRQHSPARNMAPPSSPLRVARARHHSGTEGSQSPLTSPVPSASEFSSPVGGGPGHHIHHHRRQPSGTASELYRPPTSPRLLPQTSNPQPRATPTTIKDFDVIKAISKGAFGSVYLAKKKSTGEYFAIKVLRKADMVAKNQVTNVKAERAIMMWQGESDFVAKLYWTFANKDYLFLVMEYLNGGDCASLVKVLSGLPEDWSKKYIAEVVMGVEHLHSRGIVHRDLKPDNLLIDQKGHLKLTDFGLSRMGLVGRQKRAQTAKPEDPPIYDLLKQGPFPRVVSGTSSRSTSFDIQGTSSPAQTPSMTPAANGELGQPSYFSLSRENSRHNSTGRRSESETSEGLQAMLRKLALSDEGSNALQQSQSPIEEETGSDHASSPDPYPLQHTISLQSAIRGSPPPHGSNMLPPTLVLFDPQDTTRKFVGTPDYLAPETINGSGQDEVSDWWSLGCILFEFLYGYPPFHADTPDQVFENILARKIDWPPEEAVPVSLEARDLMEKLMCIDPEKRLGANPDDKFPSGGDEIRHHPWFADIDWSSVREAEAQFVPAPENPEDTEYFDARGATLQSFTPDFDDPSSSPAATPNSEYPDRPHDALSRVRNQVNSVKRGLMPLHIPPHVRDGRSRRLSEPVAGDDFGSFSFKNLPVLDKANKDVIQKLRAEAMQVQNKPVSALASPNAVSSPAPSLESSPILPMPLKRTLSSTRANRPSSPLLFSQPTCSPNRISQPSSPLLVQFSAGQHHERRKTSSSASSLSQHSAGPIQPGNFLDSSRLGSHLNPASSATSPVKLAKSPSATVTTHDRSVSGSRAPTSASSLGKAVSPRGRSHTVSSQEGEDTLRSMIAPNQYKRRSQVFEISPSSSDTEDTRQKAALLRVQRRRQSSRRLSQIMLTEGSIFRPLDVLICEDHPVSRLVMERLLEKLRCRSVSAQAGPEAVRIAMSDVKFDIIMMEYKLPQINGADVARMVRDTNNANKNTPIVCVTGYLKELPPSHHFDGLIDKPPTLAKLTEILGRFCQWKPAPAGWAAAPTSQFQPTPFSGLRRESGRSEDSPVSTASSYAPVMPSSSYRGSSREDSISSSFFGDNDSRAGDLPSAGKPAVDEWGAHELTRALEGLGISGDLDQNSKAASIAQFAQLQPQSSAPPVLEHIESLQIPKKKQSAEKLAVKRRGLDSQQQEFAESGDDEDDELGNVQIRARSPRTRPRGSSKLGTEMLRTNSQGSVVSVDEITISDMLPLPLPPAIAEYQILEEPEKELDAGTKLAPLTPPEMFPLIPGESGQHMVMDMPEAVTPKAHNLDIDPDPTPRPGSHASDDYRDPDPTPKPLHIERKQLVASPEEAPPMMNFPAIAPEADKATPI